MTDLDCRARVRTPETLADDFTKLRNQVAFEHALRVQAVDLLRAATAYVELFTGRGVQEQPSPVYVMPNGDFDAELIAKDARGFLAHIDSKGGAR